jgi:hypothetical protein
MNRKQLTLLIVLGVVLGGLGWVAYNKQRSPYKESTQRMGSTMLPDFPLNDVAQITIKQGSSELNVVKKDDLWTVKERGDYPANFSTVSDFLRKVWELKVAKPVRVTQARLPQLELVPPDKGPSTLVEFKDKSGKTTKSLLLGAKHMRESSGPSQFGGGGSWPDGRYVMIGNDLQSVALVSETFNNAEPKADDWLNKDFFKIEKHKSISVVTTNATNNWKISRESETGEWKLADAKPSEQLDSSKSSSVTSALSYPSFNDIAVNAKPEETGLDKPILGTIETFDGFTYTAKIGKQGTNDNYYFQVAVAGDFPKERAPGKDEKPEDKDKLDKEFKEKTEKLQEKLKTEQALGKWTYLVSKWTIDPLLKERKDLVAEKKEEPKKEETKPDEPKKDEAKDAKPDEAKKDEKAESK